MLLNINPHTKVTAPGGGKSPYTHQKNSCREKKEREKTGALERKKGISAVNSRSVCLKTFQIVERTEKCISWGRRQGAEGGCASDEIVCTVGRGCWIEPEPSIPGSRGLVLGKP